MNINTLSGKSNQLYPAASSLLVTPELEPKLIFLYSFYCNVHPLLAGNLSQLGRIFF